ncbi:multicopper oxidase domain-containing protein [Mucilaginibacter robiniae]|uniref:Multicopper oxidase domain-containing protein n=1 Tax=Mucilaginibacter robiniae TaxID=2728022 RepID=A0A7L5DYA9_9SPHI|nr:multicopper oxidase domain-containing protein [Mucilaginibacter robiniae]QJD95995.1 multicopper oxidase domain-containing protein [Mucilaginibacter robiniae]
MKYKILIMVLLLSGGNLTVQAQQKMNMSDPSMKHMHMDATKKPAAKVHPNMRMNHDTTSMKGMKMDHSKRNGMDMGGMDMGKMKTGDSATSMHQIPGMKMRTMAADTIASTSSSLNDHRIHAGKRVIYDLFINDTIVAYAGKKIKALAINGQIPGPVLRFTEGDTAIIRVHNLRKNETSIHWHGILVPNKYDGVPYISTIPIKGGATYTNIIPLHQTGTFWYHTHTELDEQAGLYGPIVIEPQVKKDHVPEQVLMLSDWTNYQPKEVLRMLKRGTDWLSIQKGSVLSYGGAITKGYLADKLKLDWMRMPAMDLLDVKYDRLLVNGSIDQQLPQFEAGQTVKLRIINGSASSYFWLNFAGGPMTVIAADGLDIKPVVIDKILIGTAETYDVVVKVPAAGKYEFRATIQDISGKVSAWLGTGQAVKAKDIPKVDYYKFTHTFNRMMSQMKMPMNRVPNSKVKNDGLTFSSTDSSMKMKDEDMKEMDMKSMKSSGHMEGMKMNADSGMNNQQGAKMMNMAGSKGGKSGMKDKQAGGMKMGGMDSGGMGMGSMNMPDDGKGTKMGPGGSMLLGLGGDGRILSYDMLEANSTTAFAGKHTVRTYHLYLTGSMIRYTWLINNKPLSEADRLLIRKGEIVRFVLHNTTMMEHPMHLHGHFFRVLNAKGDSAPLKHTVSIEPMQVQTIEFLADEAHDWFFHCHTLYHLMSGMARVVRYEDNPSNPDVAKYQPRNPVINDDRQFYTWFQASFHSQTSTGSLFISNTRYEFNANYRFSYDGRYEVDPRFQRYLDNGQYFAAYIGGDFEKNQKGGGYFSSGDKSAVIGLRYLLPMFIQTDARINQKGKFRFTLSREDIPVISRLYVGASYNTDNEWQADSRYILSKYLALSISYDNQYGFGGGLTIIY